MANKAKDLERQKAAKMAAMFVFETRTPEASERRATPGGGKLSTPPRICADCACVTTRKRSWGQMCVDPGERVGRRGG